MNYRGKNNRSALAYRGFALPTVLIASFTMMMILLASVSATVAVRSSLAEQYNSQLAKTAAAAGVEYAKACLKANNNVIWDRPLKPDTDCNGDTLDSCPADEPNLPCHYVAYDSSNNIKATFTIGRDLIYKPDGTVTKIQSIGSTDLIGDTAASSTWRKYEQSAYLDPKTPVIKTSFDARVLVVGGGGSGASDIGGGGGGGGVKYNDSFQLKAGATYNITVGEGGTGGVNVSNNGNDSLIKEGPTDLMVARGGGYGGRYCGFVINKDGNNGGNGGGAGGSLNGGTCSAIGGQPDSVTAPYTVGNKGGDGIVSVQGGGGGGGAGGAGEDAKAGHNGGDGGDGILNSISGEYLYYGGGGGGGGSDGTIGSAGVGGIGGGGAGALRGSNADAISGTPNSGGGGGGHGFDSNCGGSGVFCKGGNGGSGVVIISYKTGSLTALGGSISYTDSNNTGKRTSEPYGDGYTIHTFTSSDVLKVAPKFIPKIKILVIAGGGGAGVDRAGGGGAGGVFYDDIYLNSPSTDIIVGAGGHGAAQNIVGDNGGSSSFGSITTYGGGGGGAGDNAGGKPGQDGGSGGGGGNNGIGPCTSCAGGASSGGGYAGGTGTYTGNNYGAGGGGGAGGPGQNGTSTVSGNGGLAKSIDISGTPVYYAGGGGAGAYWSSGIHGLGGGTNDISQKGGAGDGTRRSLNNNKSDALANTGGGGGSDGYCWPGDCTRGGNGGSGIVVVRVPAYAAELFEVVGGVLGTDYSIEQSGQYTLYYFKTTGITYQFKVK